MIGEPAYQPEEDCKNCKKLSALSHVWNVNRDLRKKNGSIAEMKGHLLQRIQVAVNLQGSYQPKLTHLLKNTQDCKRDVINSEMHDVLVDRLRSLSRYYSHSSKTFFLAVSIMDRFISVVKAKPHHLLCIAVASYYLAVKAVEKSEDVMSPDHLVRISQCGCTRSDVARMEKIITSKLNWEVDSAPTPLTFLELFHAWCVAETVLGDNEDEHRDHIKKLTNRLEGCLCNFPLTIFHPSVLAFSLLSIELPQYVTLHNTSNMENLEWVLTGLQQFTRISDDDIQHCQYLLREFLLDYCSPKCKRPFSKLVWIVSTRTARTMRFSAQISTDLQTIPENSTMLSDQELVYDCSSDDIWESDYDISNENGLPKQRILVVTAPSSKSAKYSDPNTQCILPDTNFFTYPDQHNMAFCVL